jgi:hypothetical protein
MNSKKIGNIGEAHALAKLVELGIPVYVQFGDNEAADYIILIKGKPLKIQVKTSTTYDGEKVIFDLSSSTMHRKNGVKQMYSTEEVDAFICYDVQTKNLYVFKNVGNMTAIRIRYSETKNNQKKNINYYEDFLLSTELLEKLMQ